jgi:hypothetical protein
VCAQLKARRIRWIGCSVRFIGDSGIPPAILVVVTNGPKRTTRRPIMPQRNIDGLAESLWQPGEFPVLAASSSGPRFAQFRQGVYRERNGIVMSTSLNWSAKERGAA